MNTWSIGVVGYHVSLTRFTDKVLNAILKLIIFFPIFSIHLLLVTWYLTDGLPLIEHE